MVEGNGLLTTLRRCRRARLVMYPSVHSSPVRAGASSCRQNPRFSELFRNLNSVGDDIEMGGNGLLTTLRRCRRARLVMYPSVHSSPVRAGAWDAVSETEHLKLNT
jgi:hypothetical protein